MLKSLRKYLATSVAALALAVIPMVAIPAVASAQDDPNIRGGLQCGAALKANVNEDCQSETDTGFDNLQGMITTIINIFSILVGVVSVIMIIFGGFKYVTSGGDSGNVSSAKNTIIYAVIGLVIVALAQFIVQFVLKQVSPTT